MLMQGMNQCTVCWQSLLRTIKSRLEFCLCVFSMLKPPVPQPYEHYTHSRCSNGGWWAPLPNYKNLHKLSQAALALYWTRINLTIANHHQLTNMHSDGTTISAHKMYALTHSPTQTECLKTTCRPDLMFFWQQPKCKYGKELFYRNVFGSPALLTPEREVVLLRLTLKTRAEQ